MFKLSPHVTAKPVKRMHERVYYESVYSLLSKERGITRQANNMWELIAWINGSLWNRDQESQTEDKCETGQHIQSKV